MQENEFQTLENAGYLSTPLLVLFQVHIYMFTHLFISYIYIHLLIYTFKWRLG